jgi:hypothetical protein
MVIISPTNVPPVAAALVLPLEQTRISPVHEIERETARQIYTERETA